MMKQPMLPSRVSASAPHRPLVWARDCTLMWMFAPNPPRSAVQACKGTGVTMAASSSNIIAGGSIRPPGCWLARIRMVRAISATNAPISGAVTPWSACPIRCRVSPRAITWARSTRRGSSGSASPRSRASSEAIHANANAIVPATLLVNRSYRAQCPRMASTRSPAPVPPAATRPSMTSFLASSPLPEDQRTTSRMLRPEAAAACRSRPRIRRAWSSQTARSPLLTGIRSAARRLAVS